MLILSRKIGETIMVGDEIEIVLTRIERDSVRIAINAPKSVKIYRAELLTGMDSPTSIKHTSPGEP